MADMDQLLKLFTKYHELDSLINGVMMHARFLEDKASRVRQILRSIEQFCREGEIVAKKGRLTEKGMRALNAIEQQAFRKAVEEHKEIIEVEELLANIEAQIAALRKYTDENKDILAVISKEE
jgi:hypothetical protein